MVIVKVLPLFKCHTELYVILNKAMSPLTTLPPDAMLSPQTSEPSLASDRQAWLADQLQQVRLSLTAIVPAQAMWLAEALQHSLGRSGKLLRPQLALWCGKMVGCTNWPDLIEAAAVAEMIHIATLLHDDVLDDAALRRGLPTVKHQWGNSVAILSGDYLLAQASRKLATIGNIRLVAIFSDVLAALCDGEVTQLCSRYNLEGLTWEGYLTKSHHKTACLYAAACESAGVVAQLPENETKNLIRFGQLFGLAFQLVDDLLDFTADAASMGKPVMNDLRQGLVTAPVLLAMQHATHGAAVTLHVKNILAAAQQNNTAVLDDELASLPALLQATGCYLATRQAAEAFIAEGLALLAPYPEADKAPLVDLCQRIFSPLS
jgi:geranylgeranyl pyrophosphate synthase